ncbi:MAG: hypothetical protein ACKO2L_09700 [Planctomycetaceae bacterium]
MSLTPFRHPTLDQPAERTLHPLAEQLTEDCDHRQCQYTSEDLANRRLLSESVREIKSNRSGSLGTQDCCCRRTVDLRAGFSAACQGVG